MKLRKRKNQKNTKGSLVRTFIGLLNGNFLTRENAGQRIPYLLFMVLLIILYIGNTHYAEKTVRETAKITKELKELRAEYITTKFELMFKSRQSEVAKAVMGLGLKEPVTPPVKIALKNDNGS